MRRIRYQDCPNLEAAQEAKKIAQGVDFGQVYVQDGDFFAWVARFMTGVVRREPIGGDFFTAYLRSGEQESDDAARRLRKANILLRTRYPILTSPAQYAERYLACQRCEDAKRDNLGYAVGCRRCGCGSDSVERKWRVLNSECADGQSPRWIAGDIIPINA